MSFSVSACAISCFSATPDGDIVTTPTGNRVTYANGVQNAADVRAWVYSNQQGYGGGTAYYFGNSGGGIWTLTIPHGNHPGEGTINVLVYIYDSSFNPIFCDYANFVRNTSVPAGGIYAYIVDDKNADGVFNTNVDKFIHDPSAYGGDCLYQRAVSGITLSYSGPTSGTISPLQYIFRTPPHNISF